MCFYRKKFLGCASNDKSSKRTAGIADDEWIVDNVMEKSHSSSKPMCLQITNFAGHNLFSRGQQTAKFVDDKFNGPLTLYCVALLFLHFIETLSE